MKSKILNAKKIAILPHINADGDAWGSSLALADLIKDLGKEAVLISEEPLSDYLNFLASKDDYKVFPVEEKFDLAIAVDCADVGRIGKRFELFEQANETILIDHHITNKGYAKMNRVEAQACATGEIIFDLFCEFGIKPKLQTAERIFTAIMSDTGGFRYSSTSAKCLRQAAELLEIGVSPSKIATLLYDTKTKEEIALTERAMKSMTFHFGGKMCIIAITKKDFTETNSNKTHSEGFSELARSIKGVEIGAFIREEDEGVKVSLRAKEFVDVSKIASFFGGGGHIRASGYNSMKSVEEAKKELLLKVGDEEKWTE